jgi:hypothetical protein
MATFDPGLSGQPLFTNDPLGFAKAIVTFFLATSPIYGLVVWFLRKGPDDRINRVEGDVTNLGRKVDAMDRDREKDRADMLALHRDVATNQTVVVGMLNRVAVDVARIEERGKVGESIERAFVEYGNRIERALLTGGQRQAEDRG